MVTDFDDKTLAPTKILKHKNVHIYFSLMTLLSEQTLSTEGNRTEFKRCEKFDFKKMVQQIFWAKC